MAYGGDLPVDQRVADLVAAGHLRTAVASGGRRNRNAENCGNCANPLGPVGPDLRQERPSALHPMGARYAALEPYYAPIQTRCTATKDGTDAHSIVGSIPVPSCPLVRAEE